MGDLSPRTLQLGLEPAASGGAAMRMGQDDGGQRDSVEGPKADFHDSWDAFRNYE